MINLHAIKAAANAYKGNGLARYELEAAGFGGMSPRQRDFHSSTHQRRLFLGGNQSGKTYALCAESWFHALGRHPFRRVPEAPNIGWCMVAGLNSGGWANYSRKMFELMPPGVLSERCRFDAARGFTVGGSKIIELAHGGLIIGKSGTQDQLALSGSSVDWLAIDEPPKQGHWSESRTRVAAAGEAGGPVFMAMTPITGGRSLDWLKHWVIGDEDQGMGPREDWDLLRVVLNHENCPHRTPESIEAQIASYGAWERNQRVNGDFEGVTVDAWIPLTEDNIFDEVPQNVEEIGIGLDHGEKPGNSVAILVVWDGFRLYQLDEYVSKERNTPRVEAREIKEMLNKWGIPLTAVTTAVGDSNSLGRMGLGMSVNEALERAFAELLGRSRPPFNINVPWKGKGSIAARARMLSNACLEERFKIHSGCKRTISALRHWRGESFGSSAKHYFDALGYVSEKFYTDSLEASSFMII